MAHHVEPMDVDVDDIESEFDNKENTYHHSNVLPRSPCTEKGYEELDVSELNMKLRYSITPAASPMSKSMSHCLDNRYNTSTDESLNNTVVNENEINLTRSLHSALNKTDSKSTKVLPLQTLPAELTADSNRNSTILQPLATTLNNNDITITVSNENEIDNVSFPSSSSSLTHTPEATTPTKEIPKDGGSPIMRGLKSVLSMFRSSQSPIPPAEAENKAIDPLLSPADVQLSDSKPQATASTPINQKNKERSISRRNSPHKESIVFNEDLEKELQWNDDSTIIFSTEKVPIHKLFFQDKPASSKTDNVPANEDVNSSVEYMDVSYNDLSIKERTLNATANKSTNPDIPESDGEFVDCETTFTQEESQANTGETISNTLFSKQHNNPERDLVESVAVNEITVLDSTVDIIKLIDCSQVDANVSQAAKQLDFSTTDIVNRLSDLINASESIETTVSLDKHRVGLSSETPIIVDVIKQTGSVVQPELSENLVTSPENPVFPEESTTGKVAENVSTENVKLEATIGDLPNLPSDNLDFNIEPVLPAFNSAPVEVMSIIPNESISKAIKNNDTEEVQTLLNESLPKIIKNNDTENVQLVKENSNSMVTHLSPVDIPLPNEDDLNKFTDNFAEENQNAESLTQTLSIDKIPQNAFLAALDKTTIEFTPDANVEVKLKHVETDNNISDLPCQLSLLPSDVPLPNINDNNSKINSFPHEAVTAVPDPVQPQTAVTTDVISAVDNIKKNDSMCVIETAPDDNANKQIILPPLTDTIESNEEEKMDVSYCDKWVENMPENLGMDVTATSCVELHENFKIKVSPKQTEQLLIEKHTFEIKPELPEATTQENEIAFEEDISIAEKQIENELAEPAPTTVTNNSFQDKSEIVSNVAKINISENVAMSNPVVFDTVTSLVFEMPQAQEKSLDRNIINTKTLDVKINDIQKDILNEITNVDASQNSEEKEIVTPTVNVLLSSVSSLPATSTIDIADEVTTNVSTKEDVKITEPPKDLTAAENSDTTVIVQNLVQPEEKTDEEIVVSENSSPFVSISAEEEFDPEAKKKDFYEIVNPLHNKSPPMSPKIVSKGYNLNFDDMDSINPFATKTKIRMSPPPGASPNTSVETVNYNKTEEAEFIGKVKNDNRRTSMPEKKKPVKAKRNFNSTFDNTESVNSKQAEPTKHEDKDQPKKVPDIKQENSQKTDKFQTDIATPNTQEVTLKPINLDATYQVTDQSIPDVNDSNKDTTMQEEELGRITNKTNKNFKDIVMNESCKSPIKSDNTSSSEQSTYLSAATSSTECIESKNVFNLPEIDDKDFNPFATKSKIRQSPPPDLDMINPFATKSKIKSSPETSFILTQNDVNATVPVDSGNELKEATYNTSNCSGSSKTSEEKDLTVQEVHTEDEDTIEGPFLEADDGIEGDKISELNDDKIDIDLNNLHAQANEDDTEAAEMFIDAETFEFLMNQNNTDEVAYSGKESLFLKFDPLFARRVTSEGVAAALSEIKKRQSTPKKTLKTPALPKDEELMLFEKPVAGPSDLSNTHAVQNEIEDIHDDMNVTVLSKPMMAVTPAVNSVVTPKKCITPNRTNRLSMTFTSPAMAVIDRLLSLSGNSPSTGLDAAVTHASRERTEADQALTQLRELLAEKEINVYNLRCESKELKNRLSTLETQMKSLEAVSAERLKKVNELTENLAEKTKINRSMAAVVEEYERTIASLISETEQDKKRYAEERNQLIRERDEQTAHLTSMEVSFSDLHSKYEKSKQVIMGYKTNEDVYKNSIKEFEDNLAKMHTNYELLKQHATSKLNHANQELEKLNKAHEAEILKFNAMIKRKDLHITSLEESLAQKTKANEELTAICDELINKVG